MANTSDEITGINKIDQENGNFKKLSSRDILDKSFCYPPEKANYLINISKTYKYVYLETPKVACSTIKRTFQKAEVTALGGEVAKNIHDKNLSPLLSPLDIQNGLDSMFEGDEFFRFSFVRNPYSRILSAYLDLSLIRI